MSIREDTITPTGALLWIKSIWETWTKSGRDARRCMLEIQSVLERARREQNICLVDGKEYRVVHADNVGWHCSCPDSHRHMTGGGGCPCCVAGGFRLVPA